MTFLGILVAALWVYLAVQDLETLQRWEDAR